MSTHQINDQTEPVDAACAHALAEQSGTEHPRVPMQELLKNKHIKVSFAEVAEYLLQIIVEQHSHEHAASSTSPTGSAPHKVE